MTVHIYLDESGDTGWRFDHPYTKGGSSRHLIIAACLLLPDVEHMPERMLRNMYKRAEGGAPIVKKSGRKCHQTLEASLQVMQLSWS
jgi:hypothetical protein